MKVLNNKLHIIIISVKKVYDSTVLRSIKYKFFFSQNNNYSSTVCIIVQPLRLHNKAASGLSNKHLYCKNVFLPGGVESGQSESARYRMAHWAMYCGVWQTFYLSEQYSCDKPKVFLLSLLTC